MVVTAPLPGGLSGPNQPPTAPLTRDDGANIDQFAEIGVSGLKDSGVVIEELLPQLASHRAIKVYRQCQCTNSLRLLLSVDSINWPACPLGADVKQVRPSPERSTMRSKTASAATRRRSYVMSEASPLIVALG
jgi:hypothetical protein